MMILLTCLAVLLLSLVLYIRRVYSRLSNQGVRHSSPVPLLGNMMPLLLKQQHFTEYIDSIYNQFPGDKFVGTYQFVQPIIVLRDLELVKQVVVKDFDHFHNHRNFFDEKSDDLFGRTLFLLKDQEWKDMRSTLSPAFTSSKIRAMVPFMVEVGKEMIKAIKMKIQETEDKYIEIDAKDLGQRYANDVIASCAFGLKVDSYADEHNQFYEMAKSTAGFTFKQLIIMIANACLPKILTQNLNLPLFSKATRNFYRNMILDTMIEREKNNVIRPDMIHLLMEAKKGKLSQEDKTVENLDAGFATAEESPQGKKNVNRVWQDNDLVAQAIIFLMAGFETVSTTMAFLMHELALHPDVQDKLVQEIIETEKRTQGSFDYKTIQEMTYLDMVVSEVLRLWPPGVAMDRVCTKDYILGSPNNSSSKDYIIRAGEGITCPIWSYHRDPRNFPDPLKFDPERFSEKNKSKIKPFSYLPFGAGPRNCIGSRFALCEVKAMTYQLLRAFQLSPSPKTSSSMKLSLNNFNLELEAGHWVRFTMMT